MEGNVKMLFVAAFSLDNYNKDKYCNPVTGQKFCIWIKLVQWKVSKDNKMIFIPVSYEYFKTLV